jgi:murein DD-endopeptidase MepM/ murein hydrolase activator NlpD
MKLFVAAGLSLLLASCNAYLGERPYKSSSAGGDRDRYESAILASSMARSASYQAWVAEGRRALRDGLSIRPSFREIVHFGADDATAVGYRLSLYRGQRLHVRLDRPDADIRLFAELFEVIGNDNPIFRLVHSADAHAEEFSFEAHTDGPHVLRIQPELLKGADIAITLSTAAGLTFPVQGKTTHAIGSFFGDPRDGGRRDHEGIDIFAPRGTPVIAVTDGVVTEVSETRLGGRVVWQHDPQRDVTYYYAHLDEQDVHAGQRLRAGAVVGKVGNTGNARTTPPHLHFAIYKPGRVAINPIPFIFDAPGDVLMPVLVDLDRLGDWTETLQPSTLHASPARDAAVLAELPSHTRMRVLSGVREWHRVQLADGRHGFIPGQTNLLGMR